MGITMSEPVVDKNIECLQNDRFVVGSCAMQGWRMTMEDSHTMFLEMPGDKKAAFFAVFDGHGGSRVSDLASSNLHRHIVSNENFSKGDYKKALEEAFLTFDTDVRNNFATGFAGTTAICCLIVDDIVYCANIGDSRGVACINGQCVPLSHDHKPDNEFELKRINAAGGFVQGNRVNGNLALSRAFGDFQYKENYDLPAELQVVSPFPDIETVDLNNVDFIVLACDGIWDVLSSEEVVEFVVARFEEKLRPEAICEQLTTRCLATDYELVIGCDNMTIVLICCTKGLGYDKFCQQVFNKSVLNIERSFSRLRAGSNEGISFEAGKASAEDDDRNAVSFPLLLENNRLELNEICKQTSETNNKAKKDEAVADQNKAVPDDKKVTEQSESVEKDSMEAKPGTSEQIYCGKQLCNEDYTRAYEEYERRGIECMPTKALDADD